MRAVTPRLRSALVLWWPVVALPPLLVIDALLTPDDGPRVTALGAVAAVAGCLPLLLRRRLGFFALAPLLTGGVVLVLWAIQPGNTVALIPIVALAEFASRGSRRRAVWMAAAVTPCVIVSIVPFADSAADLFSIALRNLAYCWLAIAAGDVVRSRREAVERLVDVRRGEERLRIARELHDIVAHSMVAINVQAGVAAHLLDRDPEQARGALLAIKDASGEALSDLRATLGVLRSGDEAAPVGPAARLGELDELTNGLRAAGVAVELDVPDELLVPAAVHAAGYRIVQEALTNVLRHAGARHVRVVVRQADDALEVEVVDDGVGRRAATSSEGAGQGVRGMRERAAALDGTLESGPLDGGGWRVVARLPLRPAGAPA